MNGGTVEGTLFYLTAIDMDRGLLHFINQNNNESSFTVRFPEQETIPVEYCILLNNEGINSCDNCYIK